MEIVEKDLPVSETVGSFCEILGLDPLYMGNEGKMLAIVSEEDADKAIKIMSKITCSKDSVIIGKIVEGKGVYMKTTLGGKRVIDILYGEGLPRIC
jgi:hydrogenase expression/formation protein HypE